MNLTLKVLLTLMVVIVVALTTAGLLIGRTSRQAYEGYVSGYLRRQMDTIALQAADIYDETGSWTTVQSAVDDFVDGSSTPSRRAGRGRQAAGPGMPAMSGMPAMDERLLIVHPQTGAPLADSAAAPVGNALLATGTPLQSGDTVVARLVAVGSRPNLGPAEEQLLTDVRQAIFTSALIAGLIALLVGGLLAISILRPLRRLEAGVARVAAGDLSARVEVMGRDEIGHLALNFNEMAANLERQELLRQRLVADIAHELRTPLSVAQGNLQAILDGIYPLEEEEIRVVYEETQLLSRLVSDLHDLSQAEAGQLTLVRQQVVVRDVLNQMAHSFEPVAARESIHIEVDAPATDLMVEADPDRLYQILHNLLGNALRHTPPNGLITLSASRIGSDMARLAVCDSGPGIPDDQISMVFERFYRGESSRVRDDDQTAGAGLGLAIVKALVEAQGGEVGVANNVAGSVFWCDLPAA